MVEVERNTFYRRQLIPTSGAVKLNAMFKDLSEAESTTVTLGGGPNASRYVFSGTVADTPKYGDSELKFGKFKTWVSGADLSETAKLPNLDLYLLKKDNEITEGSMKISPSGSGGDDLMIIASWMDGSIPWMEENFDGSDKSLGEVTITSSGPVGTNISFNDPYVLASEAASLTFAGGGSFLNFGEDLDGPELMQKYFSENGKVGEDEIQVRPLNKSKMNGFWIPKNDHRTGLKKATVFRPIWKMRDMKAALRFKTSRTVATDIEGAQTANPGNTIFNSFSKTADIQTAYTSGPDTSSPWCMSAIELSNEMVDSGGQALKMYHLWAYNSGTCHDTNTGKSSEEEFGKSGSINPQYARASMDNIPFPTHFDQGYSNSITSGSPGIDDLEDGTTTYPEINLKFAINKMDRAVRLDCLEWGADNASVDADGAYKFWNFASGNTFTGNRHMWTYGRSFTVTFSNYPPEEGENLDEFMFRTMFGSSVNCPADATLGGFTCMRMFGISGALQSADTSDSADGIAGYGQQFSAWPLMVNNSATAGNFNSGSARTTAPKLIQRAMVSYLTGPAVSGTTGHTPQCIGTGANPSYRWIASNISDNYNGWEKAVPLSMGKFVNAKIVIDPMQFQYRYGLASGAANVPASPADDLGKWNCTGYSIPRPPNCSGNAQSSVGQYSGSQNNGGLPFMRVYFTEGFDPPTTSEGVVTDDPFIDIPFFQRGSDNTHGWSWLEQSPTAGNKLHGKWPRCMTLWLQNYRYVKNTELRYCNIKGGGSGGTPTGPDDPPIWHYHADYPEVTDYQDSMTLAEHTAAQGVAREAEVFVDSITFNNWNTQQMNASSKASTSTSIVPLRKHANMTTKDWTDLGGAIVSAGPGKKFKQVYSPTYMCVGFESGTTDMPLKYTGMTPDNFEGYLLMNGFSSQGFSGLVRQKITGSKGGGTVQMWPSTISGAINTSSQKGTNMMGCWHATQFRQNYPPTAGSMPSSPTACIPRGNSSYNTIARESSNTLITGDAGDNTANMGLGLGSGSAGTASLATDGLTQKGTLQLYLGPHSNAPTIGANDYWIKRENHMAAAKVIGYGDQKTDAGADMIKVDNPAIFDMPLDTEYIIYQYGYEATDTAITGSTDVGKFMRGNGTRESITQTKKREGEWITLKSDNGIPLVQTEVEDGTTAYVTPINPSSLPMTFISPKKYWLNIMVYPGDTSIIHCAKSGSNSTGKTYDGVVLLSGTGGTTWAASQDYSATTGSTYNENKYYYVYNSTAGKGAIYGNSWVLDADPDSNIETNIDFGYGAYDEEKHTGGMLDSKPAYDDRTLEFDITKAVKEADLKDGDDILVTMEMNTPSQNQLITLYGNDWTGTATGDDLNKYSYDADNVRPQFIWGYEDLPPEASNFAVKPTFDLLNRETNLYELTDENLNSVTFTWDEEGDDIWYRMIFVDDKSITDKYHGAVFHLPLNEAPKDMPGYPDYMTNANANTYYYGSSNEDGSLTNSDTLDREKKTGTGSTITTDIQGFQGYGQYFKGSVAENFYEAETGFGPATSGCSQATIVTHLIPENNLSVATNGMYIWSSDYANATRTQLWIDTNKKFNFYVSGTTLQSRNAFEIDGDKPYMVALTFNKDRAFDNWKMYVNGVLEDTSAGDWTKGNTWNQTSSSDLNLGVYGPAAGKDAVTYAYKGFLEEIVFYNREYFFPSEDQQYILDTSYLKDAGTVYNHFPSGAADNYQSAKIFLFDYHNIRGRSPKEVATTSQTSWKVTTV